MCVCLVSKYSLYLFLAWNSTTIIMLTLTYIKINICIFWEGRGAFCLWCTSFWPKATSFLTYFVHKKYAFCTGLYSASRWNKPINVHFKFEGNWLEIFATDFFFLLGVLTEFLKRLLFLQPIKIIKTSWHTILKWSKKEITVQ